MATVDEIAYLRLLTGEPTEDTYTEEDLETRIDAAVSMDHAALGIWVEKAAAWAALADISEGGSSRSMGALQANAIKMVAIFQAKIDAAAGAVIVAAGTRVSRLTR